MVKVWWLSSKLRISLFEIGKVFPTCSMGHAHAAYSPSGLLKGKDSKISTHEDLHTQEMLYTFYYYWLGITQNKKLAEQPMQKLISLIDLS